MFESNIDNIESLKALIEKDKEVRQFLEYFVGSSIVRYRVLSDFHVFYHDKKVQIDSQLNSGEEQDKS